MTEIPSPPRVLKARGKKLWRDLHDAGEFKVEFSDTETQILLEVCRCADTIDALAGAIAENGSMVAGSQGQLVLNPAIAELRQQQASLLRLVSSLHLPEQLKAKTDFQTARGRAGASSRWSPLKAVNR